METTDEHTKKSRWSVAEDAYLIHYASRGKTFEQISDLLKDKGYTRTLNACRLHAKLLENTHGIKGGWKKPAGKEFADRFMRETIGIQQGEDT